MLAQPPTGADTLGKVWSVFGSGAEPMFVLEARARRLLPGREVILWEGDAATFQFSYISPCAERLLGHAASRWVQEATFWADTVVHPDDRNEAIAFCALATGQCRDHDFVYRAVTADGRTLWLHDVVQVIRGARGVPERLRGIMLDVTHALAPENVAGGEGAPAEADGTSSPSGTAPATRILVVEDDEVDRMALRRHFAALDPEIEIHEAEGVMQAIGRFASEGFDCVFLDFNLPDGDGLTFLRGLRNAGFSCPVVMSTGQEDPGVEADLRSSGAADYIAKGSVTPARLRQALRSVLGPGQKPGATGS